MKAFLIFTLKVAGALVIVNAIANLTDRFATGGLVNKALYFPDSIVLPPKAS